MVNVLLALIALLCAAIQGNATPPVVSGRENRPTMAMAGFALCLGCVAGWFLTRDIFPARVPPILWLFVSPWVHADPFHLTANLCAILLISPPLERAVGWRQLVLVYAAGTFTASLVHLIASGPEAIPLAGASSGIHAMLCTHAVRFRHVRIGNGTMYRPSVAHVALLSIAATAVALFLMPENRSTALSHLAGATAGGATALLLGIHRQQRISQLRENAIDASASGRHDVAIHLWRTVLESCPDNLEAHAALAEACIAARHFEAAGREVSVVLLRLTTTVRTPFSQSIMQRWASELHRLPLTPAAALVAAGWFVDSHEETRALAMLSDICQSFPGTREAETALLRIARIQLRNLRQPDSAGAVLAEFLRLYPDSPYAGHARQMLDETSPLATARGIGS
jgi:membrane associated rhomboid family serine protease